MCVLISKENAILWRFHRQTIGYEGAVIKSNNITIVAINVYNDRIEYGFKSNKNFI